MDKNTANKLRTIIAERKISGDMLVNKGLVDPKDEIDFIKKKICEVFIDFANKNNGKLSIEQIASDLDVSPKDLQFILYYHIDRFSLEFIISALTKLAKIDQNANKTLHRIALAV